jgi:hypothetical protein
VLASTANLFHTNGFKMGAGIRKLIQRLIDSITTRDRSSRIHPIFVLYWRLVSFVDRLMEAKMTRFQTAWATLFILMVSCSVLFSNVAFALNDPK